MIQKKTKQNKNSKHEKLIVKVAINMFQMENERNRDYLEKKNIDDKESIFSKQLNHREL